MKNDVVAVLNLGAPVLMGSNDILSGTTSSSLGGCGHCTPCRWTNLHLNRLKLEVGRVEEVNIFIIKIVLLRTSLKSILARNLR